MKIGFVGYPSRGHLNATTAVARRLQPRGHEAVFIGVPDTEPFVRAAGLTFVPYREEEFPMGSMTQAYGARGEAAWIRGSAIHLRESIRV